MDYILHMASGAKVRLIGGGPEDRVDDFLDRIKAGQWVSAYKWLSGISTTRVFRTDPTVHINGALVERITEGEEDE